MAENIVKLLQKENEIYPDQHDGSYELVRETVRSLKKVDKDKLDYKDMDLLFFMTVGTFSKVSSFQDKKKRIEKSNLALQDKERLKGLLDQIMQKARAGEYDNSDENGSIGMFGSGFSSFVKFKAKNKDYADFISNCAKILHEEDEEKILDIANEALNKPIQGLGIAAVSQILHCLKPYVFPILNQGSGAGIEGFKKLGIKLKEPTNPTKYVQNTRIIRDFRNKYFNFKNYRVIDLFLWNYHSQQPLKKPFSNIFKNREEANWAFNFMSEVAKKLGVLDAEDSRVATSIRHGGKSIHFVYCSWLVTGFYGGKDEGSIILPLIKEKAKQYEGYHHSYFTSSTGDTDISLYNLPLRLVRDINGDLYGLFEETLAIIHERFKNHKKSQFRDRPSHISELTEMIFDEEKREIRFQKGLRVVPNIWWVNQGKNIDKEKEGGYIWAPLKSKKGQPVYHWETLEEVYQGDIILHYSKGELKYVSLVSEPPVIRKHPLHPQEGEDREGRLVITEYHELTPPIPLSVFNREVSQLYISQSPIDKTSGIKEGYLFRFNEDALKIIQDAQPETRWPEFAIIEGKDNVNPYYPLEELAQDISYKEDELASFLNAIQRKGQAIIYGPPGTGKTYIAEKLAKHLIGGGEGFHEIIQFHPAYTYEDFIQGIRPQIREDNLLEYRLVPGRFMTFCEKALSASGLCVLIIDEINRANLSRVFGELMYLLEYRNQEIPLASGKKLHIPENIRIIGTMNTADRSIALVDYALRRRFVFLPLRPNYEVLKNYHQARGIDASGLIEILRQVNKEIGDPHYEVGHSFFMVQDLPDVLKDIWQMEIIPYLEEYFFDQPDKVLAFTWDKIKDKVTFHL